MAIRDSTSTWDRSLTRLPRFLDRLRARSATGSNWWRAASRPRRMFRPSKIQLFRDSLLLGILSQAGDAGDVALASGGG